MTNCCIDSPAKLCAALCCDILHEILIAASRFGRQASFIPKVMSETDREVFAVLFFSVHHILTLSLQLTTQLFHNSKCRYLACVPQDNFVDLLNRAKRSIKLNGVYASTMGVNLPIVKH